MRGRLAAAAAASLVVAALSAPGAGAQAAVTEQNRLETALVKRVNAVREARGLPALRGASRLTRAADRHAASMSSAGYFRHELLRRKSSPRWVPFSTWIRTFWPGPGATAWGAGENLAWGAPGLSARQTVGNWMRSPGHRANLLNRSWRRIGVAALHVEGPVGTYGAWDEVTIVVAEFGFRR